MIDMYLWGLKFGYFAKAPFYYSMGRQLVFDHWMGWVYCGPKLTHRKLKPSSNAAFWGWLHQVPCHRRRREMEEEDGREADPTRTKTKKVVINIPSYQEVIESSQSKSTPPSLFAPSQSFSQAFSYLKSSEFYSPPPQLSQTTDSRYLFSPF